MEDKEFGSVRCTASSLSERLLSKAKVRNEVRGGEAELKCTPGNKVFELLLMKDIMLIWMIK